MNSPEVTPAQVRSFLLNLYAERLRSAGENAAEIPDSYDFLLQGVIDSFGILEMVGELEKEFGFELDMSGLDAEQMTVLGPLSHFVATQSGLRKQ